MERHELEQWLCGPDTPPPSLTAMAETLGLRADLLADTTLFRTAARVQSLRFTLAVLHDAFVDDIDVWRWLEAPRSEFRGASARATLIAGHGDAVADARGFGLERQRLPGRSSLTTRPHFGGLRSRSSFSSRSSSARSRDIGKNSDCLTPGNGVFQPRASCHRMRFSRSDGAASGTSKRMRDDASAARVARPRSDLESRPRADSSRTARPSARCAVYGVRSGRSPGRDEARAHVRRHEVEHAHRRQAEHQLDRLHHARLAVERAVHDAAARVRRDRERDRAMAVDVIDAVLRVVLDDEDRHRRPEA